MHAIEGKKLWNVHTVATSGRAWGGLFHYYALIGTEPIATVTYLRVAVNNPK